MRSFAFVRARAGLSDVDDGEPAPAARSKALSAQPAVDWRAVLRLLEDRRFVDPGDWLAVRDAAAHTARFSFQTSRVLQTLGVARDLPPAP